jgi:hypothetical protein
MDTLSGLANGAACKLVSGAKAIAIARAITAKSVFLMIISLYLP